MRTAGATLDVRGRALGSTLSTGGQAQLKITDGTNETNFLATLVGGGGAAGTKTISVVRWAIGENTTAAIAAANMGNSLVTYVDNAGFRALDLTTEYNTFAAKASNQDNIRESRTADLTGIAGQTINSLVLHNANTAASTVNVTGAGASQTLTVTSGALLFTLNPAATASSAHSLNLGGFDGGIQVGSTNEYVIHVVNPTSDTTTPTLTATISSPLNSTGAALTKSGRGTLILTGANTYTGVTTLNEGTLQIASLSNVGSGGAINFFGGTLRLAAGFTEDISTRTLGFSANGGTLDVSLVTAGVTLANGLDDATPNTNDVLNIVARSVTTGTTGLLTIQGSSSYTGTTIINQSVDSSTVTSVLLNGNTNAAISGNLQIGNATSGTKDVVVGLGADEQIVNTSVLSFVSTSGGEAYFKMFGHTETVAGISAASRGVIENFESATDQLAGNATLIVNSSQDFSFTGYLRDKLSGTGGTLAFTKQGTGTQTLSGASIIYTGPTTISDGTLRLLGTTGFASDITDNANLILEQASGTWTLAKTISGTGSVNKAGAGTVILTGANSYGATMISGGTLQVGNNGTAGSLGSGDVTNHGSLVFYRTDNVTVANAISGTGSLEQKGTGTTTLTAANSYTGLTTVSAGTLEISSEANLGATPGSYAANQLTLGGGSTMGTLRTTANMSLSANRGVTLGTSGGAFNTNAGTTLNVQSVITGGGALTKSGEGTLTLSGANTYTGSTTVTAGVLSVTGSLGNTGGTTVNSGAALAVHGTLSGTLNVSGTVSGTGNVGALSIQSGGKLAAGNGASGGTLTATSLTLYSGSTLDYYLGSTFTAVTSTDGLTINGGQFNLASGAGTFTSYHLISFAGSIQGPADLNTVLSVNPADKVAGRTYNFVQNGSWIDLVIDTTNHSQLVGDALTDVRVLKNSTSTPRPVTINNTGEATHYSLSNSSAGTDTVLLSSSAQFPIASNATDSSVSVGWANTGTVGARTGKIAITNVDNAADTPADTSVSGAVVDNRVLTAGVVTGLLHAGQNATTLLTTTGTDSEATRLALAGSATSVTDGGVTIASASSSSTAFNSADSSQTLNVTLAAGKYSGTNVNITGLVSLAETLAGATVLTTNVTINADVFSGNGTWSGGSGSWGTGASTNWADENGVQAAPGTFGVAYANTDTATFSGTGGTVTLDSAVSLKSITFTNSAYTIAAGGGSLALASNSGTATVTVSGGTASHAINAPVTVDSSSNLEVSVIGGATLTFGANVTVDSGKSLIVGDATHTGTTVLVGTNNTAGSTVINYGTLQVGDGTTASRLISSTITLYNSGELNLQANAAVTASGGLNLYDNSKVTGVGTVNGNVTLHNSSTFQSTSLILNGTLTAVSGSSGSTTAGTATTVTGNTTVEGTFTVVGSSTYTSEGTVDVSGSLANPALFNVGGTVTSVGGITVSSYGTLSIDSGANVGTTGTGGVTTNVVLSGGTVGNNGTINGNLNVNGTGGALSGSGVVSGTVNVTAGTFTVNADGGNPSSFTAQSIVVSGSGTQFNLNGQTATVQQSMSVGSGSSFTTGVGGHLIDNGSTITWDSNSLVTVNADASVVSKHVIINGTGNLVESAGSVGTSGGLIQIQATGDGLELSGATLTLQSDSSYNRAGKLILDSGAGSANASQTVAGGAGLWVHAGASTIKSSGTGTVAGSVNLGGGQTVFLDSNASLNLQNLNLTNGNLTVQAKDNTGKLLFSGSNTVEGAASILSGVLTLARDVSASSPVLSFGTTSNGLTIGENATLVVGENATGSGTVTVDGDLSVAGNMAFYVGGSGVADLLVVNDTLTLDNATISVNLTSDLTASTYYLVDYTTAGGTFTLNSVVDWGTTTYNHAGYQLGYDSHSIYIAVVPEPSTWAMLLTAGLMGGIGYWRRRRHPLSGRPCPDNDGV